MRTDIKLNKDDYENYTSDIYKLSLAYAKTHPIASKYFDSFDDYIQELRLFVLKRLNLFNSEKSTFGTFCYMCFVTRIRMQIREFKQQPITISLDTTFDENEELSIKDTIVDTSIPNVDEIVSNLDNKIFINKIIKCLSDETLMHFYYNLNQAEIAKIMHTTIQNISQKIDSDINRVRQLVYNNKLNYYLNNSTKINNKSLKERLL